MTNASKSSAEEIAPALWRDIHAELPGFAESPSGELVIGAHAKLAAALCEYGERMRAEGIEAAASMLSRAANDLRLRGAPGTYAMELEMWSQRIRSLTKLSHAKNCAYLTSHPTTGDEGALCSCGAYERAHQEWLADQAKWLIWSFEHNAWWAPNERGYTKQIKEAGRYPLVRAMEIVRKANYVNPDEALVPAPIEESP